ncbi:MULTISPECIES: DUF4105 domain-containing protein [Vitreoscilla]|uniref:DUF4105 domain-containing protein n=1 Tax=Vitreoscilla stercoraria TaxID=61 RepID=A0ABY4EA97_VITST|nr:MULTISPECIES: DUF4105 domain-containing protein [Vitreoscilla]UOO92315.1 DUF4105 domain-containing protein [Vitreoscilla stercoraria]
MLLLSAWLAMAWHTQQAFGSANNMLIGIWLIFSLFAIFKLWQPQRKLHAVYTHGLIVLMGVVWFLNIPAQQERLWQADVAKIMHYEKNGSIITLHNVRNFNWRSQTDFDARWETRQYDLNHITGINVIASYWMGPQIAHTLVSFDFKDQTPLVFSIEIRKEKTEEFSAIGGFFRQFELSLIAADEKDIVYTRSNVRGEQVYFFPIQGISQHEMQALFLAYLAKSDSLRATPQWYNTLLSNCTTLIYSMAQKATHNELPLDYRILASGYLPNYLHDVHALNPNWDMKTWYQKAHVNPRVIGKESNSQEYSDLIRQGLPQPN